MRENNMLNINRVDGGGSLYYNLSVGVDNGIL